MARVFGITYVCASISSKLYPKNVLARSSEILQASSVVSIIVLFCVFLHNGPNFVKMITLYLPGGPGEVGGAHLQRRVHDALLRDLEVSGCQVGRHGSQQGEFGRRGGFKC